MEIEQLRTFLQVVEHGNFSRAAQSLHVTQSTVSFRIKGIEDATGIRLLDRSGARVQPTPAGRILHRYAVQMVALDDEATARLRSEDDRKQGLVSIAASTIPAEYLLPGVLARFRSTHPAVAVRVNVVDSGKAISILSTGAYDFALTGASSRDPRLLFAPFAEDRVILVGPSPNPFAPKGKLLAKQLTHIPLLVRELGSGTRDAVADILAREGVLLGSGPPTIEIASTEALKRCVQKGLGLAFISERAVHDELQAGTLTAVEFPGLPVQRNFYLARLKNLPPSTAAQDLADTIIGKFDSPPVDPGQNSLDGRSPSSPRLLRSRGGSQ